MTNADRIRAMSDEELAEWIYNMPGSDGVDFCKKKAECEDALEKDILIDEKCCINCLKEWLQQPAGRETKENSFCSRGSRREDADG